MHVDASHTMAWIHVVQLVCVCVSATAPRLYRSLSVLRRTVVFTKGEVKKKQKQQQHSLTG